MAEDPPIKRLRRIASTPRRARDVLTRILREPRHAAQRSAGVNERVSALSGDVAGLTDRITELSQATARDRAGAKDLARGEGDLERAVTALQEAVAAQQTQTAAGLRQLGATTAALIAHATTEATDAILPEAGLVSIILPVRDRPAELRAAVTSVLGQTYGDWELLIVDDRSVEDPVTALGALASDPRIRVLTATGRGAAAARNHGIGAAVGHLVAFVDSDNWWYPRRLEQVIRALPEDAGWAIDQQLVLASPPGVPHVRDMERPLTDLDEGNFIDLGSVVVRRALLQELPAGSAGPPSDGPFDTALDRLSDWDLIQRLAARCEPARIPLVGHVYVDRGDDRISVAYPYGPAHHRIRSRIVGRPAEGLRVLAAEWHFPQLTETYIQADIAGLLALGAEVEVWSEEDVQVAYEPGVSWQRGSLEAHIEEFRPHLVLSHWLHNGRNHRSITKRLGIPHAVRCHGFDYDERIIAALADDPGVVVHLFPHLIGRFADRPNVIADTVAFDPQRVSPTRSKDRQFVLRLTAGLHTKDLDTFFRAAQRCPDHRFVLGIGRSYGVAERTDELIEQARASGAQIEILTDLSHEKAAALTMEAGIYLHTHGTDHVLGNPISPVEAMATGAVVLARELPGAEYLAGGALFYRGATPDERADHAASLIHDTMTWSDQRWTTQAHAALNLAWTRHPADLVVAELLGIWRERFDLPPPPIGPS